MRRQDCNKGGTAFRKVDASLAIEILQGIFLCAGLHFMEVFR
jgi:hypothetical protein